MKFVSWNIQQGGGSRADRIIDQLRVWNADVVGLLEFHGNAPSQRIANALIDMGLEHQVTTLDEEDPHKNCLLLASRWPVERQLSSGVLLQTRRWLHVKVQSIDVMLMHIPNRDESKYHGIKDVKYRMHDAVIETFIRHDDYLALAVGDTNTGQIGLDEVSRYFNNREDEWFTRINASGWGDVWRNRNPRKTEYTWYTGGRSDNGFRLDLLFAPNLFASEIAYVRYDWGGGGRAAKLSDHAALVFELKEFSKF